jgi:hypothetical protein
LRLREVYSLLEKEKGNLINVSFHDSGADYQRISGYRKSIQALERLRTIGIFESIFDDLSKNNLIVSGDNDVKLSRGQCASYIRILNNAISKCDAVTQLIEKHVPEEDEKSIAISIPSYDNLSELASMENKLSSVFKMLSVSEPFKEQPTFEHFDVGSDWLLITFISIEAVNAFARIISLLSNVKRKNIDNRIVEARLKDLELSQSASKEIRKKIADANVGLYQGIAKTYQKELGKDDPNPEVLSQLQEALRQLDNLMTTGVSFHQSTLTKTEDKYLFPSSKEQQSFPDEEAKRLAKALELEDSKDNDG